MKDAPDSAATELAETFASLPFTSLALSGTGVWYFVLRELNEFGLYSQNITPFTIELDGSDDEILQRPTDPKNVAVAPATTSGAFGCLRRRRAPQYLRGGFPRGR